MQINPLWWVHLRIGGDARQPLWLAGGYVALMLVFVSISFRMSDVPTAQVAGVWVAIVGGVQAMLMLIAAPNAVHKAVQRDFQSGMMESLRLTPLAGRTLALGYLLGPPLSLGALFLVGLVAGTIFVSLSAANTGLKIANAASIFIGGWFALQGVLLLMSAFVSSLMLLSAAGAAGSKFNLFGFIVAGMVFGGWTLLAFLPGMALLIWLVDIETLVRSATAGAIRGELWQAALASVFHIAFAVVFVVAAARKLRRPEASLFSIPAAAALLVLWVAASGVGKLTEAAPAWMLDEFGGVAAGQVVFTTGVTALLALFLLNAAAVQQLQHDRAAVFDPGMRRTWNGLVGLMIAASSTLAALVLMFLLTAGGAGQLQLLLSRPEAWAACVLAIVFGAWMDVCVLYVAQAWKWRIWVLVLLLWGVYKIGFLIGDGASVAVLEEAVGTAPPWRGWFTASTPIGTLALLMVEFPGRESSTLMVYGLIPQFAIAMTLHWLMLRAKRNLRRTRGAPRGDAVPAAPGLAAGG